MKEENLEKRKDELLALAANLQPSNIGMACVIWDRKTGKNYVINASSMQEMYWEFRLQSLKIEQHILSLNPPAVPVVQKPEEKNNPDAGDGRVPSSFDREKKDL